MAVTAETRNAIIELVVTAYNGAPGTTLLTQLVEAADGGASLADIATTLTTSSTFNSIYPTFQTVTEFANEFLDNVVPSASADARAEGVAAISFVLNSGGTRADVVLQAQTFLTGLEETDATFGTPAAAFNNKVEVATYHTVTQEQDGDLGTLQSVLSGVTEDDATVTAAQTEVDGGVTTGSNVTLTTSVDTVNGTAGSDVFKGVVSSNSGQTTLGAGDTIDGKAGTDSLEIIFDAKGDFGPVATVSNVEILNLKNFGEEANSANLANISGLTQVWNRGSTMNLNVTNLESLAAIGVENTTTDYDITFANTALTGDSAVTVVLSGAADGSSVTLGATSGTEGVETVNVQSTGKANRIDDIDSDQSDFVTLNITGDQDLRMDDVDSTLTTIDASGLEAKLTATISTATSANDVKFTGTKNDDSITVGTTTTGDVIDGGDGTDSLTATGTFGATVTSIESLSLRVAGADLDASADFDKAQSISTVTAFSLDGTADWQSLSFTNLAANSTINFSSNDKNDFDKASTLSLKTATGSSDTVTLNFSGNGSFNFTDEITAEGIEIVNIGANSSGAVTLAVKDMFTQTTDVLKKVVLTGSAQVDIDNSLTEGKQALEIDASGLTGVLEMTTAAASPAGNTTVKAGGNNDTILTGDGADTIDAGAGNDTITAGKGDDTITTGSGSDIIVLGNGTANGNDTIKDFSTSSDTFNNDALTGVKASGGANSVATGSSTTKGDTAAAAIIQVSDDAASDWNDVVSKISGALTIASDTTAGNAETVILIDNGTDTRMYLFSDDKTKNATVESSELTLMGTLTGVKDATAVDNWV